MAMQSQFEVQRYGQCTADLKQRIVPASTTGMPPAVAVLGLLLLMPLFACGKKEVTVQAAPPEVEVIDVVQQDVPIYGEWIATLDGFVNAQIQPQVTGYLMKQNYKEGSVVHQGEVLFEIDPRPFQAALEQA